MVHPRQPQRPEPAHPLVPRHHVHKRMLERVAHMQRAGDVWRRNNDREHGRVRVFVDLRRKRAALLPAFVVVLFSLFRVVLFGDFHA